MNNYPIFFLPKGEIMMSAQIKGDKIKLLRKTLFPRGKRYAISKDGLAACLDLEEKLILYGQLNEKGAFDYFRELPFPGLKA